VAWLIALAHLTVIAVLIAGGPVAARWPRFAWVHIPIAAAVVAIFAFGWDCPLTTWQRLALEQSGHAPYEGGFVEHYLVHPLFGTGASTTVSLVIIPAVWLVPTIAGYAVTLRSRRTASAPSPQRAPIVPGGAT
jgi:hypothetical protein